MAGSGVRSTASPGAAVDNAVNTAAGTRWFDVTALARLEADIHFWLDPLRLADVADGMAQRLAELDPSGADAFRANAAALRADLTALDAEFVSGLATCARRDLVTKGTTFGRPRRAACRSSKNESEPGARPGARSP